MSTNEEIRTIKVTAFFLSAIIAVACFCWVVKSHFEARTYTELTGRTVTTWQAMWVQLRVIEPAGKD